jgi:Uma2 family endonuclease
MVASPRNPNFSPDEYLQIEDQSPIKHEYIDGQLYAMVGANQDRNTISLNLSFVLRRHIRGLGYRLFMSDVKVRIMERNRFFYPDLAMSCDERDRETPLYLRFPNLIVEILWLQSFYYPC